MNRDLYKTRMKELKLTTFALFTQTGVHSCDFYQAINGKKPFFPKWRKSIAEVLQVNENELFPEYATLIRVYYIKLPSSDSIMITTCEGDIKHIVSQTGIGIGKKSLDEFIDKLKSAKITDMFEHSSGIKIQVKEMYSEEYDKLSLRVKY